MVSTWVSTGTVSGGVPGLGAAQRCHLILGALILGTFILGALILGTFILGALILRLLGLLVSPVLLRPSFALLLPLRLLLKFFEGLDLEGNKIGPPVNLVLGGTFRPGLGFQDCRLGRSALP